MVMGSSWLVFDLLKPNLLPMPDIVTVLGYDDGCFDGLKGRGDASATEGN